MKKLSFLTLCLFFMLAMSCNSTKDTTTAAAAAAQPAATAPPAEAARPAGPRGQGGGQAQMEQLVAELGLNEDQKVEFEAINAKYRQQMQTMREQANGDFASMRPKMQEMRTAQNAEIKQILTEEQFAKYEKIQAERMQNRQGGRRPGGN
ncbi:MAG: hypothetical protein R2828_33305 [Saprospiraceae bacterium]